MADLYAYENIHFGIVKRLRQLGHDAVTVQEVGRAGSTDHEVLTDATSGKRAVLTFNRRDFRRLHRQHPNHEGIISCTHDDDLDALVARIDHAIATAGSLAGRHVRINKPQMP